MESKVHLIIGNKIVASGVADVPTLTPKALFPMEELESYSKGLLKFSVSFRMSKRNRSRLFGKHPKYTYRTNKKR